MVGCAALSPLYTSEPVLPVAPVMSTGGGELVAAAAQQSVARARERIDDRDGARVRLDRRRHRAARDGAEHTKPTHHHRTDRTGQRTTHARMA